MIDTLRLIKIQNDTAQKVIIKEFKKKIEKIAAFDISFEKDLGYCAGILFDEKFNIIQKEFFKKKSKFPYIPTFLAFRELEFIEKTYKKLKKPDIVLIDGHGLTHPRRCGIAVHFGVKYNIPTIGVAKSHLYGNFKYPENKKFSFSYIYNEKDDKPIGVVLITKETSKPIYISPGNFIDIKSSISIIKKFTINHRLPEPIRIAHIESKKLRLCN